MIITLSRESFELKTLCHSSLELCLFKVLDDQWFDDTALKLPIFKKVYPLYYSIIVESVVELFVIHAVNERLYYPYLDMNLKFECVTNVITK